MRNGSVAITVSGGAVAIGGTAITVTRIGVTGGPRSDRASSKTRNAEADGSAGPDPTTTASIRVAAAVSAMAVGMAMAVAPMTVTIATRASLGGGCSGKTAKGEGQGGDQSKLAHGILQRSRTNWIIQRQDVLIVPINILGGGSAAWFIKLGESLQPSSAKEPLPKLARFESML
jgi:hypothetical protein